MSNKILIFPEKKPGVTLENDEGLIQLMNRAVRETFDGDEEEFELAFTQALAQQILELSAVNDGFTLCQAEELADAMRGVLLQWLGEHSCCPREDLELFLAKVSNPSQN